MSRFTQRSDAVRRSLPLVRFLAVWLFVGWLIPYVPAGADSIAASCPEMHADNVTLNPTTDNAGHAATHHCPACGVTVSALPHRVPTTRSLDRTRVDVAGYPSRRIDPPYRPPPLV